MNSLRTRDIMYIKGIGPQKAELLQKELGIRSVYDLLRHFPTNYLDRSSVHTIASFEGDMPSVQVRGRFVNFSVQGEGAKTRLVGLFSDGTAVMEVLWFKSIRHFRDTLAPGKDYVLFGKPTAYQSRWSMVHPEVDSPETASRQEGFRGVYPLTERLRQRGIGSRQIFTWVQNVLSTTPEIRDPLPPSVVGRWQLMAPREALAEIHRPTSPQTLDRARLRLKFEELFYIQLDLQMRVRDRKGRLQGLRFPRVGQWFNSFYSQSLPFALTGAQKRVVREIRDDMNTGRQMNRLVQGDVGSGKTLVALLAMLLAVDNGCQACMMAPTEILARQHFATFSRMLDGLGVRAAVLTGASKSRERRQALEGIASGEVQILIGTHALIEDRVQFANLGFVVIDEQHRFGVEQRARLWTKNARPPHILVMTATPIPRTLAMTLYGDLDVSVIDELPPGRKPVKTVHYTDAARLRLFGFMKQEIKKGRQVYVVYPLIKESETMDYKDLTDGYESISRDFPLPEYVTTICHGQMKPADKEESMRQFKAGEAQIMVATSVIEVGVDVPNATVMVIESAERFGLSQLHQLRGRVGRGGEQSYCILMSGEKLSRESRARLDAMCETTDGFRLAELDLKLRGAGDINGTLQSGMAFDLKIANPTQDAQILTRTREAAEEILQADPTLSAPGNRGLLELKNRYSGEEKIDFSQIS